MRTIKFRGYDAVGKKGWVYGDIAHNHKVTQTGLEPRVMVGGYEVIPETVGQLVGVQDADGRNIYEGDILQSLPEEEYVAKLSNGCFHSNREAWDADPNSLSEEEKIAVETTFKVQWNYNTKAVVTYADFIYDLVETGNPLLARHFFLCRPEFWRIVGNIHDNPELLISK